MTGNGAEDRCPEDDELAELRWHWDSAYVVDCEDGQWTARFHHDTSVLSAETAGELRVLIWHDYSIRKSAASYRAATVSDDRAPRVSTDDLNQILLTAAHPALRFTIGTHGAHLACWHRRERQFRPPMIWRRLFRKGFRREI